MSTKPEIESEKGMEGYGVKKNLGPDNQRPLYPPKEVGPMLRIMECTKLF